MKQSLSFSIDSLVEFFSLLSIFLFSTQSVFERFVPSSIYIAISMGSISILFIMLILSQRSISLGLYLFIILIVSVIVIDYFMATGIQKEYIKTLLVVPTALMKLWCYFISFYAVDIPSLWREKLTPIAYVNTIVLMASALSGKYSTLATDSNALNYVGLGISMSVWVSFLIQESFVNKRKIRYLHWGMSGISFLFLMIYGNRGSFVAVFVYFIYCIAVYTRLKGKEYIVAVCGLLAIVFSIYGNSIFNIFFNTLSNIVSKFGIYSRNYRLILSNRLNDGTSRTNVIWIRILAAIKNGPPWGYGLCYDRVVGGSISMYAHNLVLELWISFGVVLGTAIFIAHLLMGAKIIIAFHDTEWERVFSPFYIVTTVLLMFNNSFCSLGLFWASYGVYFACKRETNCELS